MLISPNLSNYGHLNTLMYFVVSPEAPTTTTLATTPDPGKNIRRPLRM